MQWGVEDSQLADTSIHTCTLIQVGSKKGVAPFRFHTYSFLLYLLNDFELRHKFITKVNRITGLHYDKTKKKSVTVNVRENYLLFLM